MLPLAQPRGRRRARPWFLLLLVVALGVGPRLLSADEDVETFDPESAAEAFERAEVLREAQAWREAADAYWQAIEADRRHYDAHVRYQEASLASSAPVEDLIADYDSFLEDYPDDVALNLHRLRLDEAPQRLPKLETLRKKYTDEPDALLEIGRAQLALGDLDRAARILESLLKKKPEGDRYLLLALKAWFASGKTKPARAAVEEALKANPSTNLVQAAASLALFEERFDDAVQLAEQLLQRRGSSTTAVLLKAEALERGGKRDAAIAALNVGRRTTDDAIPVLLALGDLVGRGEDPEKALPEAAKLYEKVLAANEENPRALYGLAWVREREEKYTEAEKLYRETATVLPSDPTVIESVGFVLFRQGRISDAQVQFKKAIDLDPSYASAYANLGATFDARAEYSDAIEWYEKLLKMRGQKDNLRALVNCAFDYEQLGVFKKAEKYLERAHKISPKEADILVWLGDNRYFQERWKSAEKTYLDALELDEESFYAWRGLGLALGQQRKWADAAEALEKAKEIKPTELDLLYTLGGLYLYELEDLEKSLENFEEYIQNGGDDPDVPDLIVEIRKALEGKK